MKYYTTLLEDWIKEFYYRLDISRPYQLNLLEISARLGLIVNYERMTSRFYEQDIIIDERLSEQEQWQDFAHELCHILRHNGNQFTMSKLFLDLQENQANHFAYHFCIPTFMLLKMQIPDDRNQAIYFLANTFSVTLEFAEKRLDLFLNQIFSFQLAALNSQFLKSK
ncbi:ImmA/IrrE family metallo-endopeptidase [Peribacillus sp. JNUCC 23]